MKKLTPWFLAAIAPALAIGCTGTTFLGHIAVVFVTLGIFFGTLSMNRQQRTETKYGKADPTTNVDREEGA